MTAWAQQATSQAWLDMKEAALLRLLRVKRDLLGLKLLYQVVGGLVRQGIDYPCLDPLVVSNGLIDLEALIAHAKFRIRALAHFFKYCQGAGFVSSALLKSN